MRISKKMTVLLLGVFFVFSNGASADEKSKSKSKSDLTNSTKTLVDTDKLQQSKVPQQEVSQPTYRTGGTDGLSLASVSQPTVASDRVAYIQGRGQVAQVELNFLANVRNDASSSRTYSISTEVLGALRPHRTARFSVAGGELNATRVRFFTDFQLRSGSSIMPLAVILMDHTGTEVARVDRSLDISSSLARLRSGAELGGSRVAGTGGGPDLAVMGVTVRVEFGDAPRPPAIETVRGLFIETREAETVATVALRNNADDRWGYPGSLNVLYQTGTPGHLQPMTGLAGVTKPVPGGIHPGALAEIRLNLPKALAPGYYYTATVTFLSREDGNSRNDRRTYTFFVEENGSVTTWGAGSAEEQLLRQVRQAESL